MWIVIRFIVGIDREKSLEDVLKVIYLPKSEKK